MIDLLARVLEWPLAAPHRRPALAERSIVRADAIVVLGARLAPDGSITEVLAERVAAAAALFERGAAPTIVVTGGKTAGASRSEADALADALRGNGVPSEAILVEDQALTTADNARLTAALLAPLGARSVWIVTQPFHGRRARRLFTRAGLLAHVLHITDSVQYLDRRRALRWIVREYGAWAVLPLRSRR